VAITNIIGLAFLLTFIGLIVILTIKDSKHAEISLREIPAFKKLQQAIELSVESGSRLHISIGRGNLTSTESAAAFVGLNTLEHLSRTASNADNPPVATTGNAVLAMLARDTLNGWQRDYSVSNPYDPTSAQLVGFTPFSYAAGTMSIIHDEKATAHILLGHFGNEVALITDAGEQSGGLTLAGTDNLPAQAILYATIQEPLIGEEFFAGGAYLGSGKMHTASLITQDAFRWLIVAVILAGIAANLTGIDQIFVSLLGGRP
jgi:hypothetical protein